MLPLETLFVPSRRGWTILGLALAAWVFVALVGYGLFQLVN